jgi:hypothetical protein
MQRNSAQLGHFAESCDKAQERAQARIRPVAKQVTELNQGRGGIGRLTKRPNNTSEGGRNEYIRHQIARS